MNKFGLKKQFDLAAYKMYAELKAESSRSYLGVLWWIIEPILYLAAFYVLFVMVLGRNSPGFIPNFLCGIVVWKWFDSGVKAGAQALITNAGLLQRVNVPKYIFVISSVFGSSFKFLLVLTILLSFLVFYGISITVTWLWIVPLILLQFILVSSVALLLSSFMPFVPDLKVAVEQGMMFLFFLSGVLFNIKETDGFIKHILSLNPMLSIIEMYRGSILNNTAPDVKTYSGIALVSLVVMMFSLLVLHKWSKRYTKVRF